MGIFEALFGSSDSEESSKKKEIDEIKDAVGERPGRHEDRQRGRRTGQENKTMPWGADRERGGRQPAEGRRVNKGEQKREQKRGQERYQKEDQERVQRREPPDPEPSQESDKASGTSQDPLKEPLSEKEALEDEATSEPEEKFVELSEASSKTPSKSEEVGEKCPSEADIPDAPEPAEIEVPDIEKGPLFIRVEKFKKAEKMLAEMKRITRDIGSEIGGLRNGLEEDRTIRNELEETINRLEASLSSVKDIVSP